MQTRCFSLSSSNPSACCGKSYKTLHYTEKPRECELVAYTDTFLADTSRIIIFEAKMEDTSNFLCEIPNSVRSLLRLPNYASAGEWTKLYLTTLKYRGRAFS